jgi:hypothetical protein
MTSLGNPSAWRSKKAKRFHLDDAMVKTTTNEVLRSPPK